MLFEKQKLNGIQQILAMYKNAFRVATIFSLRSVAVSTSLVFQKDVDRQSVAPVCLVLRSGFSSQCHFGPVET